MSTSVGGIREVAQDGVHALLVPAANPAALAEKVIDLLKNQDLARRLSQKALEESKKYSVENNVRELEKLYLRVLNRT